MMKVIAIIPAKGRSARLPGKNVRPFAGLPLFLHSVFYARAEGLHAVVSTDSDEVRALCREHGVECVAEAVPDAGDSVRCVRGVLERVACGAFVLLQPTSPLRQAGLAAEMARRLAEGEDWLHTTRRAMVDGEWRQAFDGSALGMTRARFEREGRLLGSGAAALEQPWPLTEEIDTAAQFEGLQHLALHGVFGRLLGWMPARRVCIVTNKRDHTQDYSAVVDGMDVVVRVNSFDNLESGLTGTRTDVAYVTAGKTYCGYGPEHNHAAALRGAGMVYFAACQAAGARQIAREYGLTNWALEPDYVRERTGKMTSLAAAVALAEFIYPKATLYLLGDLDPAARTKNSTHLRSGEDAWLRGLVERGKLNIVTNFLL